MLAPFALPLGFRHLPPSLPSGFSHNVFLSFKPPRSRLEQNAFRAPVTSRDTMLAVEAHDKRSNLTEVVPALVPPGFTFCSPVVFFA